MNKYFLVILGVALVAGACAGCHNAKFRTESLKEDFHAYFLEGDSEKLSEAEPTNSI